MKKDHRDDKNIDKFLGFPGKQVFGNLDKDLIKQRTEKMNEFLRKTSSNKELTKYLKSFVS